ncbi:MAG: metallophosphoesterase [Bdellovibrionota bacterium]
MTGHRIKIAHLSDPHFGTTTREKKDALREILMNLSPDWVVLSGDITQRAHKTQFEEAKAFCDSLTPLDVMSIPGNHDIPLFDLSSRLFSPYAGFENDFGFPVSDRRKKGPFEIILCNSTDRFRHIQGELHSRDLARLGSFSGDSTVRIVAFHQPLDCPKHVDEKNLLRKTDQSVPALKINKVDLTLSGHIHDPLTRLSDDRYPGDRNFVVSVAGTCLSSRTRYLAPNSFQLLDISTEGETARLVSTRYDLLQGGFFGPLSEKVLVRPQRDGWTE